MKKLNFSPSPFEGEGGLRSRTDEGAVLSRKTAECGANVPLIRAALRPTFSPERRRSVTA